MNKQKQSLVLMFFYIPSYVLHNYIFKYILNLFLLRKYSNTQGKMINKPHTSITQIEQLLWFCRICLTIVLISFIFMYFSFSEHESVQVGQYIRNLNSLRQRRTLQLAFTEALIEIQGGEGPHPFFWGWPLSL